MSPRKIPIRRLSDSESIIWRPPRWFERTVSNRITHGCKSEKHSQAARNYTASSDSSESWGKKELLNPWRETKNNKRRNYREARKAEWQCSGQDPPLNGGKSTTNELRLEVEPVFKLGRYAVGYPGPLPGDQHTICSRMRSLNPSSKTALECSSNSEDRMLHYQWRRTTQEQWRSTGKANSPRSAMQEWQNNRQNK